MKLSKNINYKKCAPKMIFFNDFFFQKYSDDFSHRKLTLKVRILPFLTTQLSARLENFLGVWLLVLGIKEGLVECAAVCVKSVGPLYWVPLQFYNFKYLSPQSRVVFIAMATYIEMNGLCLMSRKNSSNKSRSR